MFILTCFILSRYRRYTVIARPKKFKDLRECSRCGSVTNRIVCEDCLRLATYFPGEQITRGVVLARQYGLSNFYADCPAHGMALFTTRTRTCRVCDPPRGAIGRAIARREGLPTYVALCPQHGDVAHSTGWGRCLVCYTATGAPRVAAARGRPVTTGLRAIARREGRSTYFGTCAAHGSTLHDVAHGRCLECFTTGGKPRSPSRGGEP